MQLQRHTTHTLTRCIIPYCRQRQLLPQYKLPQIPKLPLPQLLSPVNYPIIIITIITIQERMQLLQLLPRHTMQFITRCSNIWVHGQLPLQQQPVPLTIPIPIIHHIIIIYQCICECQLITVIEQMSLINHRLIIVKEVTIILAVLVLIVLFVAHIFLVIVVQSV